MQRHSGSPLTSETRWCVGGCRRRCRRAGPEEAGDWAGASTLCLVRGVYTTRVHAVIPLAVAAIADKAVSRLYYAENLLILRQRRSRRLGFFPGRGRPKHDGVFTMRRDGKPVPHHAHGMCLGRAHPDYWLRGVPGGVMDHPAWALSIVTRAAWAAGRHLREGRSDGGEGRGGRL